MNGIVSGKIEKEVGTLVFHAQESATLPSDWDAVNFSKAHADKTTYLKVVDKLGNIMLINWFLITNLNQDLEFSVFKGINDNAGVSVKAYTFSDSVLRLTIETYKRWNEYLASVEIGALS